MLLKKNIRLINRKQLSIKTILKNDKNNQIKKSIFVKRRAYLNNKKVYKLILNRKILKN